MRSRVELEKVKLNSSIPNIVGMIDVVHSNKKCLKQKKTVIHNEFNKILMKVRVNALKIITQVYVYR